MLTSDKTPKELMEYRNLGRTDLKVSLLSSGAWVISTKTFGDTSCYHPQAIKANLEGLSRKRIVEGIRGNNMLHRIRFEVEYANLYKPPMSYVIYHWLRQQFESGQDLNGLQEKNVDRIMEIVENLRPIADKLDGTIAQLSLAWAAKKPKSLTIFPKLTSDITEEIEQVLKIKPRHPYGLTLMN
ncbi:unnamed protein product [Adineta steineri]|uniref:Uncharacterized protein n=1 Tax=Adineta steineri TaxID=433720 RepID=A0A818GVC2_9BILA|nr:unnamed protein product [Adineta steineri]